MKKCYPLIIILILFSLKIPCLCLSQTDIRAVRPPAVAGTFYPASPTELRRVITGFLDYVPETTPKGKILAAIAPHAGYIYSGSVAAYTHKRLVKENFDTLVIIGHDTHLKNNVAITCPVDYFETPLGKIPVDTEMISKMHAFHPGIQPNPAMHARDHTVEVHLPFLQVLSRKCKIVPILFGNPTIENCRILAEAIQASADGKSVFVLASTDMSHYPPYHAANEMDTKTLECLKALDAEKLFNWLEKQENRTDVPGLSTALCSRGAVGTAMFFAASNGADNVETLRYANSGDAPTGNKREVVGYGAALILNSLKKP